MLCYRDILSGIAKSGNGYLGDMVVKKRNQSIISLVYTSSMFIIVEVEHTNCLEDFTSKYLIS